VPIWASMQDQTRRKPIDEPLKPEPISIRAARGRLGALVDEVAGGRSALICRRSMPLAVLLPTTEYEELIETLRRDQSLAAVLRARGVSLPSWTTTEVLEVIIRLLDEGRP
jgi:prevent-host-death family protein